MQERIVSLSLGLALSLLAAHNPLLPKPQEVHYGTGRFALHDLSIRFSSTPSAEDRFAAGELSATLSATVGRQVPVVEGSGPGHAIVLKRTGPIAALPTPDEHAGPESRESYHIKVTADGASVTARSSAGLFYGVQTLRQLVEGQGVEANLPEVQIRDWPALPMRGFMMDTGHGPIPTEHEIKRQIDFLVRWKVNQYFLYAETSIELEGYDLLNPQPGSRYSQEEIRRIVAYGRQRHVDVVPCMEFLGHLHDMFRLERYADLALIRYGSVFNPLDPRVEQILKDWVEQLVKLFPSPVFHIGFDEYWELENADPQVIKGRDRTRVFMDFLKLVCGLLQTHGKRVVYWSQDLGDFPDRIAELPKNAIAMPNGYGPGDFTGSVAPLAKANVPVIVGPGISIYSQVAPNFSRTFANLDDFAVVAKKYSILGLLNTGWTDMGMALYRMALPGMAYGGVASWQSAPVDREAFLTEYARLEYPAAVAAEVGPALDAMRKAMDHFRAAMNDNHPFSLEWLFWDPFDPDRLKHVEECQKNWHEGRLEAENSQEHLQRALRLKGDPRNLSSLLVGARMLDYLGMRYLYAVQIARFFRQLGSNPREIEVAQLIWRQTVSSSHGLLQDLIETSKELREIYREAWLEEYTPFRLGHALGRWDGEYEFWRSMQARFGELEKIRPGDPDAEKKSQLPPMPPLEFFRPRR